MTSYKAYWQTTTSVMPVLRIHWYNMSRIHISGSSTGAVTTHRVAVVVCSFATRVSRISRIRQRVWSFGSRHGEPNLSLGQTSFYMVDGTTRVGRPTFPLWPESDQTWADSPCLQASCEVWPHQNQTFMPSTVCAGHVRRQGGLTDPPHSPACEIM